MPALVQIINEGMGGLLKPPGHPEHTHSVRWGSPRSKYGEGMESLSSAVDDTFLPEYIRAQVQTLLDTWEEHKLPLDHEDIQAWIYQVLGYFRRCYADSGDRRVDKLTIDDRDPMTSIDTHAGVLLIRDFYPQFIPTAEHFRLARWGR